MRNLKTILFLALFFQLNVGFSQSKSTNPKNVDCRADFELFNTLIQGYKYEEASVVFKKIEKNKCQLSENDYYNAACIYSVLKNSNLALKYLQIAIQENYHDTAHMAVDKDLDNIRDLAKYKNLVGLIKQKIIQNIKTDSINEIKAEVVKWNSQFDVKNKAKWQSLKSMFSKINILKMEEVIPYKKNGLWGYMDKSGVALTKPLFDFADFSSKNGLLFVYNKQYFFYNKKGQIDKLLENNDDDQAVMRMPDNYNFELTNTPGFTIKDNQIVAHSSDYIQIGLLNIGSGLSGEYKNYLQGKTWAIVKNKEDKIAIIDSVGNPLNKVYNFVYSMDRYTELSDADYKLNNKIFYVLKNSSGDKLLFELNGNAINTEKQVSNAGIFSWYNNEFGLKNFDLYCNKSYQIFKLFYADLSQNLLVVKNENFELVFKKFYNEIIDYNGVCNDKFTGDAYYNKKIDNLFILVKEGSDIFYVDMDGREYKLKN
jgi:hypothetical protein